MKIKPLRDLIVAVMLDDVSKTGSLILPVNYKQALLQHGRALVLASGPKSEDDCPVGSIVHISEVWGEKVKWGDKDAKIGRLRDVDGVMLGEKVKDAGKYLD